MWEVGMNVRCWHEEKVFFSDRADQDVASVKIVMSQEVGGGGGGEWAFSSAGEATDVV